MRICACTYIHVRNSHEHVQVALPCTCKMTHDAECKCAAVEALIACALDDGDVSSVRVRKVGGTCHVTDLRRTATVWRACVRERQCLSVCLCMYVAYCVQPKYTYELVGTSKSLLGSSRAL